MAKLNTSAFEQSISSLNTELSDLYAKYKESAKKVLEDGTKDFFEATPEIKAVFWTQYTPHFNDGEPCEFGVGDIYYNVDRSFGKTQEQIDEDGYNFDEDDYEGDSFTDSTISELEEEKNKIEQVLNGDLPESVFDGDYYVGAYNNTERKYTFNRARATDRLIAVKALITQVKEEQVQFPNRDVAISNFRAFSKIIGSIDSNIMNESYGDGVKVVLSKDGVDIQEYDHD